MHFDINSFNKVEESENGAKPLFQGTFACLNHE